MVQYLRLRAIQLRKNGWSYNVISERLKVAKSTLSHWLREIPFKPNKIVRQRIREGPIKGAIRRHAAKMKAIIETKQKARKEFSELSHRDLWMLGLGLYIGEGSRLYESVRIINSDPDVIRLAASWFRQVCGLRSENFTVAIHLYPDTNQKVALKFWSNIMRIPLSQFGKTQIDRRTNKSQKKHRKLPYGTAHITVRSRGNPEFGKYLHRRIIGWIEAAFGQLRV